MRRYGRWVGLVALVVLLAGGWACTPSREVRLYDATRAEKSVAEMAWQSLHGLCQLDKLKPSECDRADRAYDAWAEAHDHYVRTVIELKGRGCFSGDPPEGVDCTVDAIERSVDNAAAAFFAIYADLQSDAARR